MTYFGEHEFACKNKDGSPCSCGKGYADMAPELISKLTKARELAGVAFVINSAYRCSVQNERVTGDPNSTSSHQNGTAVDIRATEGVTRFKVLKACIDAGFQRVGVAKGFIHVDVDEANKGYPVVWLY